MMISKMIIANRVEFESKKHHPEEYTGCFYLPEIKGNLGKKIGVVTVAGKILKKTIKGVEHELRYCLLFLPVENIFVTFSAEDQYDGLMMNKSRCVTMDSVLNENGIWIPKINDQAESRVHYPFSEEEILDAKENFYQHNESSYDEDKGGYFWKFGFK